MQLIFLDTSWKHQKTRGFLMFSGGIKRDEWHEMDQISERYFSIFAQYRFYFVNTNLPKTFWKLSHKFLCRISLYKVPNNACGIQKTSKAVTYDNKNGTIYLFHLHFETINMIKNKIKIYAYNNCFLLTDHPLLILFVVKEKTK